MPIALISQHQSGEEARNITAVKAQETMVNSMVMRNSGTEKKHARQNLVLLKGKARLNNKYQY